MTTTEHTVASDLRFLLHPADERDIPVPGFPSGNALEAWAKSQPRAEVENALIEVLKQDEYPQQYAAMAALRALGVDISGEAEGTSFFWTLIDTSTGETMTIERAVETQDLTDPATPSSAASRPSLRELAKIREQLEELLRVSQPTGRAQGELPKTLFPEALLNHLAITRMAEEFAKVASVVQETMTKSLAAFEELLNRESSGSRTRRR
jgi:hypothetical protein